MIRILIAEDQSLIRAAIGQLLEAQGEFQVVAEVGRGDQVLAAALETRPDVALLDIEMPGEDGIKCAAQLRDHLPDCRILILTVFGRPGYLQRALENGALGFILKDSSPQQLARAVRQTAAGERVVDPKLAVLAIAEGASPLTVRERDVLSLSLTGVGVGDIARKLNLGEGTVRNYLSTAIQKLNARNRTEAAMVASEKGWL
ncbi:MAG: DNA-binding response regulator [Candidatus Nephthysia bennettiae]|nr:MAG: DNA-binding response regulator [Candidatus Dormibacteraeota bacterium]